MTRAELKEKCEALAPYGDACAKATLELLTDLKEAEMLYDIAKENIAALEGEIDRLTRAATLSSTSPP